MRLNNPILLHPPLASTVQPPPRSGFGSGSGGEGALRLQHAPHAPGPGKASRWRACRQHGLGRLCILVGWRRWAGDDATQFGSPSPGCWGGLFKRHRRCWVCPFACFCGQQPYGAVVFHVVGPTGRNMATGQRCGKRPLGINAWRAEEAEPSQLFVMPPRCAAQAGCSASVAVSLGPVSLWRAVARYIIRASS